MPFKKVLENILIKTGKPLYFNKNGFLDIGGKEVMYIRIITFIEDYKVVKKIL